MAQPLALAGEGHAILQSDIACGADYWRALHHVCGYVQDDMDWLSSRTCNDLEIDAAEICEG